MDVVGLIESWKVKFESGEVKKSIGEDENFKESEMSSVQSECRFRTKESLLSKKLFELLFIGQQKFSYRDGKADSWNTQIHDMEIHCSVIFLLK